MTFLKLEQFMKILYPDSISGYPDIRILYPDIRILYPKLVCFGYHFLENFPFFVLKYRRQFKQRRQIMGHCCSKEIFLDKFIGALILCQNERNLSILALILILAAFLFLLHIFGVKTTPIKGSPLSQGLSYTPACYVSLPP